MNKQLCEMCGEMKEGVTVQPTPKALVFGWYPGSFYFGTGSYYPTHSRCRDCEKEIAKNIKMTLRTIKK